VHINIVKMSALTCFMAFLRKRGGGKIPLPFFHIQKRFTSLFSGSPGPALKIGPGTDGVPGLSAVSERLFVQAGILSSPELVFVCSLAAGGLFPFLSLELIPRLSLRFRPVWILAVGNTVTVVVHKKITNSISVLIDKKQSESALILIDKIFLGLRLGLAGISRGKKSGAQNQCRSQNHKHF
jgi:hypothetical protein